MLQVKSIRKAGQISGNTQLGAAWTEKHLVVVRFNDPSVGLVMGSTFAVGDYTITANLDELANGVSATTNTQCRIMNPQTNSVDYEKTFEATANVIQGMKISEAYGFQMSIAEIFDNKFDVFISDELAQAGFQSEITSRYVVGVGADEKAAYENGKNRIKAQLLLAVQKQKGELISKQATATLND